MKKRGGIHLAFSMYSLETTSEREFVCPFKTTVTTDSVNFGQFKTFAFSAIDENNSELETVINESIEKELKKKGMAVDIDNPDILIQTFYFFDKNPNYTGANKIMVEKEPIYRFNFLHSKMEAFPFLSPTAAEAEAAAYAWQHRGHISLDRSDGLRPFL